MRHFFQFNLILHTWNDFFQSRARAMRKSNIVILLTCSGTRDFFSTSVRPLTCGPVKGIVHRKVKVWRHVVLFYIWRRTHHWIKLYVILLQQSSPPVTPGVFCGLTHFTHSSIGIVVSRWVNLHFSVNYPFDSVGMSWMSELVKLNLKGKMAAFLLTGHRSNGINSVPLAAAALCRNLLGTSTETCSSSTFREFEKSDGEGA